MTCDEVEPLLADLALDLADGDERARAVAHVDGCERCRRVLAELTAAADRVVTLAPPAEPSAGFEARVLAALPPAPEPAASGPAARTSAPRWRSGPTVPRARGVLVGVAAAVALVVAGVVGWSAADRSGGTVREAAMVAPAGADVGDVYVHAGNPAWLFVSVPAWTEQWGDKPYTVEVTTVDGRSLELAGGDLRAGAGGWGTVLPVAAADVRTVTMLGPDGREWCRGTLA